MKKKNTDLSYIFGLSEYEARLFEVLNEGGAMNVSQISNMSRISRTAIYPPLKSLIKRGFVSESAFGKRKYYTVISLHNLESVFESKRSTLNSLLLSLNNNKNIFTQKEQLNAQVFIGKEGIKSAGIIFLNETTEKVWYSFEDLAGVINSVSLEFEDYYIKERVKRNIKSKMILSNNEDSQSLKRIIKGDKEQLRETIILSQFDYIFDATVVVSRGILMLINPSVDSFALIIRNVQLANTFCTIHRLVWDRYKVGA